MLQRRALAALRIVWLGAILTGGISWVSAQQILSVSSHTVTAGSNVTVAVNLNQGTGIGGIQFDLLYDTGFLRIVDSNNNGNLSDEIQRGGLLEAGHLMVANATDPGRIAVVIAGTTSFFGGSGSVVTVTFQILGTAGSTALTLNNVIASDPLGSSVAVTSSGGTITVQGASNQAPNAVNDTAVTAEDTPVTINVLANDTDPNGDALTVLSVTPPAHGSATIQNGTTVRYVPVPNFFGSDSFTYTADDGRGGTDTATVSVNVTSVNDPPNARSDSAETTRDTPVAVAVLSNDSDPDGDALTITAVTQPIHGSATIQNGTAVVYTPSPGYEGSDSFGYTVSDGKGGTASAQVTITVQQAPPGPALLLFPQFVDGGDSGDSAKPNSSRIIIRNNSEQEATLRLLFRNANGTPLQVPVQGQAGPVSEVHRTIEAMGVEEVETAGTGSLKSGIVEVEPLSGDPGKLQGTLVFSLFGTFVSSESSPAQSESLVFVSVDPDTTLGENTGIAAYNPDPTNSATVRLRLAGCQRGGSRFPQQCRHRPAAATAGLRLRRWFLSLLL